MTQAVAKGFQFSTPHEALDALLDRLGPVGTETISWEQSAGRVLAEPLVSDRPSPPCDASAMDGYAARLADLTPGRLEVAGEISAGQEPPPLPAGKTLRIFTGAPVPAEAEAVIKREDVIEHPDSIEFPEGMKAAVMWMNIRRRGENLPKGEEVLPAGSQIGSAAMAAMAGFGMGSPSVYRRLRVGVIVTGDEVLPVESKPAPWQLRDSNGPALRALLSTCAWIEPKIYPPAPDRPDRLESALREALEECDAVLLTGGVSMGDYDYVPEIVERAGAKRVFHKLPVRPGKPVLAAVGPQGQAILGLPGNPVSVLVSARRFAAAALRKRAGFRPPTAPLPTAVFSAPPNKTLDLWWYRPARFIETGVVELVGSRGSGDFVSSARSDGFVETPPDADGIGPWPFYSWQI
jgi:molybdopterin molybdotransferase